MSYIPLEISSDYLASGLLPSMRAMRLPKGGESDSTHKKLGTRDAKLAAKLVKAGPDHAKAMRGIIVWVELRMQVGWMIEFETYRHGVECLSTSSSMHGELSRLSGADLAEQKQADLPDKVYIRICTISYQALRSMYRARRRHRHPDWRIFCDFIETLPYFESLIYPEAQKNKRK